MGAVASFLRGILNVLFEEGEEPFLEAEPVGGVFFLEEFSLTSPVTPFSD